MTRPMSEPGAGAHYHVAVWPKCREAGGHLASDAFDTAGLAPDGGAGVDCDEAGQRGRTLCRAAVQRPECGPPRPPMWCLWGPTLAWSRWRGAHDTPLRRASLNALSRAASISPPRPVSRRAAA